jgi:hypothetical protein
MSASKKFKSSRSGLACAKTGRAAPAEAGALQLPESVAQGKKLNAQRFDPPLSEQGAPDATDQRAAKTKSSQTRHSIIDRNAAIFNRHSRIWRFLLNTPLATVGRVAEGEECAARGLAHGKVLATNEPCVDQHPTLRIGCAVVSSLLSSSHHPPIHPIPSRRRLNPIPPHFVDGTCQALNEDC